MTAARSFLRRTERQLDFEVEATEPDHAPATGRATLIQPPTIPSGTLVKALAAVAAIAAVVFAWSSVVKPAIQEAADDAVRQRIGQIDRPADSDDPGPTTDPVVAPTVPDSEPVAAPTAVNDEGDPVAYRVTVDVGINQNRSESISIPPDARFMLSDVVFQNTNGDLGTAQLLRNGDVLYEIDLGEMNSANEFQPRITPIPFEPNDNVVLAVDCLAAGKTTGTGCEVAALLGGRLVVDDR